jgi:hypothetical protein
VPHRFEQRTRIPSRMRPCTSSYSRTAGHCVLAAFTDVLHAKILRAQKPHLMPSFRTISTWHSL